MAALTAFLLRNGTVSHCVSSCAGIVFAIISKFPIKIACSARTQSGTSSALVAISTGAPTVATAGVPFVLAASGAAAVVVVVGVGGLGGTSTTITVISSRSPRALSAALTRCLAACPGGILRTARAAVFPLSASHNPSDAKMSRAPSLGRARVVTDGCGTTMLESAQFPSPIVRLICKPPGHTRGGPHALPSTAARPISPPAAITRLRSSSEFSTRWSVESAVTCAPSSR